MRFKESILLFSFFFSLIMLRGQSERIIYDLLENLLDELIVVLLDLQAFGSEKLFVLRVLLLEFGDLFLDAGLRTECVELSPEHGDGLLVLNGLHGEVRFSGLSTLVQSGALRPELLELGFELSHTTFTIILVRPRKRREGDRSYPSAT